MKSGSTGCPSACLSLRLCLSLSICRQLTNEKWRLKAFYACANFTFTVIANWRLMQPQQPRTAHSMQHTPSPPLTLFTHSLCLPFSLSIGRPRQILHVNVVGNGHLMFNFSLPLSPLSLSSSHSLCVCLFAL